MKHYKMLPISILFVTLNSLASVSRPIAPVEFIKGCWKVTNEDGSSTVESWDGRSTDSMFGHSYTFNATGETQEGFEFLKIDYDLARSLLVYRPFIKGVTSGAFSFNSEQSTNTPEKKRVVFSDPTHDFPKDISYTWELASSSQLLVELSGNDETGAELKISIPMESVLCSGGVK